MAQATCAERITDEYTREMENLREVWENYCNGEENEDVTPFHEYGLCFDYVSEDTFEDMDEGFFRYQISWGGPADEFRFFVGRNFQLERVEYWFLDWFDGASVTLTGDDFDLLSEIFEWFKDIGSVEAEYEKAMEDY